MYALAVSVMRTNHFLIKDVVRNMIALPASFVYVGGGVSIDSGIVSQGKGRLLSIDVVDKKFVLLCMYQYFFYLKPQEFASVKQ